ncbi:MAG: hypothetical protein V4538_14940 [Bacteroidota bacterium]
MSQEKYFTALKSVSIAFAEFIDTDCIRSFEGWLLREPLVEYDGTEFELDELYDYWKTEVLSNKN